MTTGTCDSCGKQFKVPSSEQTYRCKACRGTVRVGPSETASPASDDSTERRGAARAPHRERSRRREPPPAPVARERSAEEVRIAGQQLKEIRRSCGRLRAFYGFLAAIQLMASSWYVRLAIGSPGGDAIVLFGAVVSVLQTVFLLAAAVEVVRAPRAWSIVVAVNATFFAVLQILARPDMPALLIGLRVAFLIANWLPVLATLSLARLVRENSDLRATESFTGRRSGRVSRKQPKSPAVRSAYWAGAAFLAAAAVVWGHTQEHGSPLEDRGIALHGVAESFAEAWNASEWPEVGAHFPESSRAKMTRSLERFAEQKDWQDGTPQITQWAAHDELPGRAELAFRLERGVLETTWVYDDGGWWLSSVDTEYVGGFFK